MLIFILFLLSGGIMVYLSQNNFTPINLHLGPYTFTNIPLFYIIIGSLLLGLCLAYLIYLINSIFVLFSMHGKDNKIKKSTNEIADLNKKIQELELENEKLKRDNSNRKDNDSI